MLISIERTRRNTERIRSAPDLQHLLTEVESPEEDCVRFEISDSDYLLVNVRMQELKINIRRV